MPGRPQQNVSFNEPVNELTDERQPLLQPMSQTQVGTLCTFFVTAFLISGWCLVDSWNRTISAQLFDLHEMTPTPLRPPMDPNAEELVKERHFNAPFLLAFIQFMFMGLVFLTLFCLVTKKPINDVLFLKDNVVGWRWPVLILTHVFGTFWLQALMLPKAPLSLGAFAASRSLEVPVAAVARARVFGTQMGKRDYITPCLMFAAAWLLFYSYSKLAGCLCIWSGHGIELAGVAFYFVSFLVVTIPALNAVTQESVVTHLEVNPILLLAVMNIGAAVTCMPLLAAGHVLGWASLGDAWKMLTGYKTIFMMIAWLCVQTTAASAMQLGLICTVNAFWTVALKSLRVVFWWSHVLMIFYFSSGSELLSISLPNESAWSFVMFCGVVFMAASVVAERHFEVGMAGSLTDKHQSKTGSPTATAGAEVA